MKTMLENNCNDLNLAILTYLQPFEICNGVSLLSKHWYNESSNVLLWKRYHFKKCGRYFFRYVSKTDDNTFVVVKKDDKKEMVLTILHVNQEIELMKLISEKHRLCVFSNEVFCTEYVQIVENNLIRRELSSNNDTIHRKVKVWMREFINDIFSDEFRDLKARIYHNAFFVLYRLYMEMRFQKNMKKPDIRLFASTCIYFCILYERHYCIRLADYIFEDTDVNAVQLQKCRVFEFYSNFIAFDGDNVRAPNDPLVFQ